MFDIDSLPEMYETMIDRPAILYDTLANFSSIWTQNSSALCSFLVTQLNYTREQCDELFNNSQLQYSQVEQFFRLRFRSNGSISLQRRSRRELTVGERQTLKTCSARQNFSPTLDALCSFLSTDLSFI